MHCVPVCVIIAAEAGRSERERETQREREGGREIEREREPGLMEEEEKMKLHLFWWLTNDFEM